MPVHLHAGHPTPWSEGIVVRIEPDEGPAWIANAQPGVGYARKLHFWHRANSLIMIARGAVYLVCPDPPSEWQFVDFTGIDCQLTPSESLAIISTYTDVIAIGLDWTIRWSLDLAIDGVELLDVRDDFILGRACIDPPDGWQPFTLKTLDGSGAKSLRNH